MNFLHNQAIPVEHGGAVVDVVADIRPAGPDVVVLLHGLSCTKDSFAAVVDAPALAHLTTCAIDLPGHGRTAPLPSGAHTLENYADLVGRVVARLAPTRLHLVGHSMGGAVGLIAAQGMRDLVTFTGVEGNLVGDDAGLVSRQIADLELDDFADNEFGRFIDSLRAAPEADLRAWGEWTATCAPAAVHESARSLVEWSDSGKLLGWYRAMTGTSFLYGAQGDRLGHLLPLLDESSTFAIPDAGHFPMVDNPHALYSALAAVIGG
ncbi:alpha/beta fold hydrolase [Umezawaea tangerina]|uniref:Pimeloyl-ACP methyl ester carboxylesterase n=1 Tax=Umezawaea tangerina TaxID=84725 RepID=A0A2T0S8H2_9PSEU|nr:alpha/beta fold hydrolase [Umezawaea tangerina]PRY29718.1 pimeloyl-ACP methyl ester carboxylesterase [Umezawaea tangerina]